MMSAPIRSSIRALVLLPLAASAALAQTGQPNPRTLDSIAAAPVLQDRVAGLVAREDGPRQRAACQCGLGNRGLMEATTGMLGRSATRSRRFRLRDVQPARPQDRGLPRDT
jgi:hypothetical protein